MFNKEYNFEGRKDININLPKEINIKSIEQRAPTDESIKIYDDMLAKARKSLLDSVIIKDTVINGVALYFVDEPWSGQESYHIKFFINGQEHIVSGKLNKDEYPFRAYPELIRKHILQAVATEVMTQLLDKIKIHVNQTSPGKLR